MDKAFVSRAADAAQFTTTPTDSIRFLCAGNDDMPDIEDERLSPGDGPPLHRHPWVTWSVVIEGTFLVRLGDEDVHLGPGPPAHPSSSLAGRPRAPPPPGAEPEAESPAWLPGFRRPKRLATRQTLASSVPTG